jgi:6-phosphogluconolactonase
MNASYRTVFVTLAFGCASVGALAAPPANGEFLMYFGTYTGFKYVHHGNPTGESHSKGIYVSRFHPASGDVTEPELAAEIVNPSFLAIHPNQQYLYAVIEDPKSLGPLRDHASYISSFKIDPATGRLHLLNTVPTGGTSTCYLSLDKTGRYVLLANYGSGSVSVLRLRDDGSLGELTAFVQHVGHSIDPSSQSAPHPHSVDVSPDNRFAVVSDLGLDKELVYQFDAATGSLSPADAPVSVNTRPGGGPRHFTFAPSGKFAYLLSEMSGIVNVFAWDPARGSLSDVQAAASVPRDFTGDNHSAEIQIHPNGKFLYESNRRRRGENRGPDTIGVFAIDSEKGTLSEIEQQNTGGIMPRHFAIDPTGTYLFAENELTDNVVLFRIDSTTGRLSPAGKTLKLDTPVCLKFLPSHD